MIFLALQAPTSTPGFLRIKCHIFPPVFHLRVMQFVTHLRWRHRRPNHVVLAPVMFYSSGCLVLYIVCFCFTAVFVSSLLCSINLTFLAHVQLRQAATHHSAFLLFSSKASPHPCFFSREHLQLHPAIRFVFSFVFFLALSFLTFLSSVSDVSSRSNTWPTALDLVSSAFQQQSHFHHAFSQSTALHFTSDELFQWRFGSYPFRSQRHRCSYTVERVI